MDITIEVTEIIAESTINETVIYCDVIISDAGGSMVDVPIETASANGVPIPIVNKNIDIIIPTKTSDLTKDDVYTKSEVDNKLTSIYKFKGSVLTYAELPTDAENADVYNVEENGVNYAWVEATESWDSLGGIVGLATLTENGLLSKEDFAKLVNLSGTNTGDETQDSLGEKIEITELTELTDTTKIATSDSAFLKWFSGARIKTFLTGFFAKLSGGNTFTGDQNFIGENTTIYVKDTSSGTYTSIGQFNNDSRFTFGGSANTRLSFNSHDFVNIFSILKNGSIDFLIGKYHFNAASPTADTINDTRTSNQSGVKIEEICTAVLAGVANVKGSGTWIITEVNRKTKTLTNNTSANLLDINVASQTMQIVRINYSIVAKDATTVRSHAGTIICNVRNQNGTVSSSILHVATLESDLGIISDNWALTDTAGKSVLSLTANAAGLTPTSMLIYMDIDNQGSNNIVLL